MKQSALKIKKSLPAKNVLILSSLPLNRQLLFHVRRAFPQPLFPLSFERRPIRATVWTHAQGHPMTPNDSKCVFVTPITVKHFLTSSVWRSPRLYNPKLVSTSQSGPEQPQDQCLSAPVWWVAVATHWVAIATNCVIRNLWRKQVEPRSYPSPLNLSPPLAEQLCHSCLWVTNRRSSCSLAFNDPSVASWYEVLYLLCAVYGSISVARVLYFVRTPACLQFTSRTLELLCTLWLHVHGDNRGLFSLQQRLMQTPSSLNETFSRTSLRARDLLC